MFNGLMLNYGLNLFYLPNFLAQDYRSIVRPTLLVWGSMPTSISLSIFLSLFLSFCVIVPLFLSYCVSVCFSFSDLIDASEIRFRDGPQSQWIGQSKRRIYIQDISQQLNASSIRSKSIGSADDIGRKDSTRRTKSLDYEDSRLSF